MDLASSARSFLFLIDVSVLTVLVRLGCCNNPVMPETGRLINNRNLFLKVLDAGESKIKVLADSVSGESLFSGGLAVKNPPPNAGDTGDASSILGLGRTSAQGNGNLLQYACLGNHMDRGAWWTIDHGVAKSQISLSTQS